VIYVRCFDARLSENVGFVFWAIVTIVATDLARANYEL